MATMVARGGSDLPAPVSPHQETIHRNKRKFRADPPIVIEQPHADDPPSYGFPVEFNSELLHSAKDLSCGLCSSLPCPVDDEFDAVEEDDSPDADWNVPTEAQLKELLLGNLATIFSSAVEKVASHGYAEHAARKAVLRSGLCHGTKDSVSSIVDSALALLRTDPEEKAGAWREHSFEDLRRLEENLLSEMVSVLREVRPFLSSGDAMWCLLICDMNLSHACAMDGDQLPCVAGDDATVPLSLSLAKQESKTSDVVVPGRPFDLSLGRPCDLLSSLSPMAGIPNLPPVKPSSSSNCNAIPRNSAATDVNLNPTKENMPFLADRVMQQGFCSPGPSRGLSPSEKLINEKRCSGVGISKRDSILRQKAVHLEKGCRAHRSKGSFRSGKISNLGSLLDRRSRTSSDAMGVNLKASMLKKSRPVGLDAFQVRKTPGISFNAGSCASSLSLKRDSGQYQLPVANTELCLSLSTKTPIGSSSDTANVMTNACSNSSVYYNYNGQEMKDVILHKLVPRVRELQSQLQEWSEWAQQKVMQAARRLSKDKAELQSLRQEKEEVSRLKKERRALEENTVKKLSEMESALSKASCQVEKADIAIHRLEAENDLLKKKMEAMKVHAAKSAAYCSEISKREMATLKRFHSWDRQQTQFREELMSDKQKLSQLQQQYNEGRACLDQLEAKVKEEEKIKDDALMLVQRERKEREQMEVSAKSKEDILRLKAENDFLLYKGDMLKLENQIAQLKLKAHTCKIAAPREGVNSTYAARLACGLSFSVKDSSTCHYLQCVNVEEYGYDEIQRERECVMCLTEEVSVVFLPCAHQVVCGTCNKLHEQQGMKDCPSCRTPIKQRITVRSRS